MKSQKPINANVHSLGKLGWIGLGHMGSRIATRLRNAGPPLMVYDRDRSKADELVSRGAELATSPADLAATVFHHLGIDPNAQWIDPQGRPRPIVTEGGQAIEELL